MALNPLLRQHIVPLAGITTALVLYPKKTAFAEEIPESAKPIRARKPIYDTPSTPSVREIAATTPPPASGITDKPTPKSRDNASTTPSSSTEALKQIVTDAVNPRKPNPTDRLASQIKQTRLFLHSYVVKAEDSINRGMDSVLSAEKSFTSTIASLAPPKESNEKLIPGSIYVLVAAMAGSIVASRRNILVRFVTPVITGVTTAHYVIPRTTANVGDLVWSFEKKYPVVADNHTKIQERITRFIDTAKAHSQMGLAMAEDKVHEGRKTIEDWVAKGR